MSNLTHLQIETMLNSLFATATICKVTSEEFTRRYQALPVFAKYKSGRSKHPHYMQMFAKGYFFALRNRIYQEYLEFCYVDGSGVMYSTHRQSSHRSTEEWYQAGQGSELAKLPSGHYWKGSDKLWFSGDVV